MDEDSIIHRLLEIFEYKNQYQLQTSKIKPQDMYVLERIYFNGKIMTNDIAKRYNIHPSTLTGIIDRLEKKKLIVRLKTNIDRRTIELVVSADGKMLVEKHLNEDKQFAKNFFNTLEPEKKEQLKNLLEDLLSNINKDFLFSPDN